MVDLLRALARGDLAAEDYSKLESLLAAEPAAAEPARFVTQAAAAGFIPLAYRHLVARAPFAVAPALAAALTAEFRRHAVSRFAMTRRLRELLAQLAAAGIDARPYKGPALAIQLLGNYAMRQFGDLDLLVRRRDAVPALQALTAAGLEPSDRHAPAWETFAREHRRHDYSLRDASTGTLVELHWALADRLDNVDGNVDWFMEEPATIDLLGAPVPVMSAERLLLALSIHGARHMWARLGWLADFAEVTRAHRLLDWDLALARARRIGFERGFAASVELAHHWFDVPRPARVPADSRTRRLVNIGDAHLRNVTAALPGLSDRLRWNWTAAPSAAGRARLMWRLATTPSDKDVSSDSLSSSFAWLYALPRGVRLVRSVLQEQTRNRA